MRENRKVDYEALAMSVPTLTKRLLVLLISGAAAACFLMTSPEDARFPSWLAACPTTSGAEQALCGRYQVWEDRDAAAGHRIELNVLVIPASGRQRLPDPIFYLAGGPGASATRAAPGISRMLSVLLGQRDLVFIDLRGTGGSNPLDCAAPTFNAPLQTFFDPFLPDQFVSECLSRQVAQVSLYSNVDAMADLEEVRNALGYDRVNLFGISGGTRSAQVFLRNYPGSVRSVVLKGVVPMDMENPLPHARGLEHAMRALLDACAAESLCREVFPDLSADWERSKLAFNSGPVRVRLTHPMTGAVETVDIPRGVYADGIRQTLYDLGDARLLPAIINAAGTGDFEPFARLELARKSASFHALSFGAFLSATCAEDLRFVSEGDIERETAGTFLGDYRVRRQIEACRIWGSGPEMDDSFQAPVRSDVPVLLISGAVDPVTSAEGAQRVADHLLRSLHVVFPNQAHDSPNPKCENAIISDFIGAGSTEGLNVACAQTTRRPPVFGPTVGGVR